MLILTRRLNERIIIDKNIQIQVLNIRGNQVRIGIEAPKTTPIHRAEIWQKIQSENSQQIITQAASISTAPITL